MILPSVLVAGFLIGMQHALEADHVAAVSSLVSRKKSHRTIIRHGAWWGIGHAAMLFMIGGAALLLNTRLDDQTASLLELFVGVTLVVLGATVLWRLWRDKVHFHAHTHSDGKTHLHAHSHRGDTTPHDKSSHEHEHAAHPPWRSLTVGLIHGMAGSAALIILTATSLTSPFWGLMYIVLFGLGSILGMAMLSAVIALPIAYASRSVTWLHQGLQFAIGSVTLCLGLFVIYEMSAGFLIT